MATVNIQDLLKSGVHFGHQTRRWNPKMKKFIFTERNGIYIIDLQKTISSLNKTCDFVREIAAKGEPILFVGTKTQAASVIEEEIERCNQYYVINRWPGGMLTNYRTIRQSIKKLEHLEKMASDGTYEHLTKKEILTIEKLHGKLDYVLGGIRNMTRMPGIIIVIDTRKEKIAVREANRLGIPVCAIVDTNSDPDPITFPIPGNDDAIRSIKVILGALTDAILEGMQMFTDTAGAAEKDTAVKDEEKADRDRRRRGHRAPKREADKNASAGKVAANKDVKKPSHKPQATKKSAKASTEADKASDVKKESAKPAKEDNSSK